MSPRKSLPASIRRAAARSGGVDRSREGKVTRHGAVRASRAHDADITRLGVGGRPKRCLLASNTASWGNMAQ